MDFGPAVCLSVTLLCKMLTAASDNTSSQKEDIHFSGVWERVHARAVNGVPIFIFLTSYVIDASRILPVAFEKACIPYRQAEHNSRSPKNILDI